ncbi:siderophore-interacting protein [Nocardiopsis metallicus]|uniref:NADPH-dependent ferric siderophore reductase n=1 Tax=Nocardiopsis metallicus TaxID=179819 RepID=A0A840WD61_9ACTN|nr:siderophore-interacting protein [Nocardiopsis metallicus]MBB5494102.1 NADPH-dependent ferric siderophore reductase [Nocardiopsis metallicus]
MSDKANKADQAVRRRSANPLVNHFGQYRSEGVVTEVGEVTPTLRRIRIRSEELIEREYTPGQHVRVEIRDPLSLYGIVRPGETLRTYTIRELSRERGEFELWAHLYEGEGIGLEWARSVRSGDPVRLWGPQGEPELEPEVERAPYHLFVGEETGACAFEPLLTELGPNTRTFGVLESDTPEDEVPVSGLGQVVRVHRNGESAASSPLLPAAVAAMELPDEPGFALVAGEARTGQAVRAHLVNERGWPREAVRVKAFWTPGRKGLHH